MTMASGTFIDFSPLVLKLASYIHFPYADVSDSNHRLYGTHIAGRVVEEERRGDLIVSVLLMTPVIERAECPQSTI